MLLTYTCSESNLSNRFSKQHQRNPSQLQLMIITDKFAHAAVATRSVHTASGSPPSEPQLLFMLLLGRVRVTPQVGAIATCPVCGPRAWCAITRPALFSMCGTGTSLIKKYIFVDGYKYPARCPTCVLVMLPIHHIYMQTRPPTPVSNPVQRGEHMGVDREGSINLSSSHIGTVRNYTKGKIANSVNVFIWRRACSDSNGCVLLSYVCAAVSRSNLTLMLVTKELSRSSIRLITKVFVAWSCSLSYSCDTSLSSLNCSC